MAGSWNNDSDDKQADPMQVTSLFVVRLYKMSLYRTCKTRYSILTLLTPAQRSEIMNNSVRVEIMVSFNHCSQTSSQWPPPP